MAKRPVLDLLIPGLFNLPGEAFSPESTFKTPYLNRLLRYARQCPDTMPDLDTALCRLMRINQNRLPYAQAVLAQKDSVGILFRPVHLKSDINNAMLYPVELDSEIYLIIKDLKDYFKVDFDINELPDKTWMMVLKTLRPVPSMPHYLSAVGKKITPFLAQAHQHIEWYKFLNEIQMFLHQHPLNQQRLQKGLPMMNSLWFWGADHYQGEKLTHLHWFSDDELLTAVGCLYQADTQPIAAFNTETLNYPAIVIDLSLLKALKGDTKVSLVELIQSMENLYFKPLMKLRRVQINVHAVASHRLEFNSMMPLKWWRKVKTLSDFQA